MKLRQLMLADLQSKQAFQAAQIHRCVAFGRLADFAGTLTKGAHVAIEGELRSHEYQRELAVGTQKPNLAQRVWEIRVDSASRWLMPSLSAWTACRGISSRCGGRSRRGEPSN